MDRELSLEELDMVQAGYPVLPQEETEKETVEETNEKEEKEGKEENLFVTENQRLVEELPFGELTEEELDNVIAGRLR